MTKSMCPHCGWQYDPRQFATPGDDGRSFALVPDHLADSYDRLMSCEGAMQPRNPETDRRPLWKAGGVK